MYFAGICFELKIIGLALGPRVYVGHQAVTNHSIELLTRLHLFDIQLNAVKTAILWNNTKIYKNSFLF